MHYAQGKQWLIQEFIEIHISSQKDAKLRRIDELLEKLESGDVLIVAELSRLGRNMLETLNIIQSLAEKNIQIVFVRQPELSTLGSHTKLLLAIYSYFAEAEREYISMRTKQGLAAAKAQGKQLGRPKGSKNKREPVLASFKEEITGYLKLQLSLNSIRKLINPRLSKPLGYNSFKYFIKLHC